MQFPLIVLGVPAVVTGILAPKAMVIWLALAALVAFWAAARTGVLWACCRKTLANPVVAILLILVLYGAVSALWSADSEKSLEKAFTLLLLFLAAGFVAQSIGALTLLDLYRMSQWLIVGYVTGLVCLAVEIYFNSPIRALLQERPGDDAVVLTWWVNRGVTVACLMLWPVVLLVWKSRGPWWALLLFIASTAVIVSGPQRAALLAIPIGAVAVAATLLLQRWAIYLAGAAVVGVLLLAPLVPAWLPSPEALQARYPALFYSAVHRLHIWDFAAEKIAEKPLTGWGLRGSRHIPGAGDLVPNAPEPAQYLSLHPHNAALQIWLELGFAGALLAATFVVLLVAGWLRVAETRKDLAMGAGLLATGFCFFSLSYGIWQSWWVASIAAAVVIYRFSIHDPGETV